MSLTAGLHLMLATARVPLSLMRLRGTFAQAHPLAAPS